jgi:superfamily II DNA/RNA helicase
VAAENDDQKYAALKDLFSAISMSQCIIYSNSVQRVITLAESMLRDQFPVCGIHSDMTKDERDENRPDRRIAQEPKGPNRRGPG